MAKRKPPPKKRLSGPEYQKSKGRKSMLIAVEFEDLPMIEAAAKLDGRTRLNFIVHSAKLRARQLLEEQAAKEAKSPPPLEPHEIDAANAAAMKPEDMDDEPEKDKDDERKERERYSEEGESP